MSVNFEKSLLYYAVHCYWKTGLFFGEGLSGEVYFGSLKENSLKWDLRKESK